MRKIVLISLITFFFILNCLNGFTDLAKTDEVFTLFCYVVLTGLASFAFGWLVQRESLRASVYAAIILIIMLFARQVFVALKDNLFPHIRPSYFLIGLVLLVVVSGRSIYTSAIEKLIKFSRFLVVTFSALILFELVTIGFGRKSTPFTLQPELNIKPWSGSTEKPNIYVLLLDEYQGNEGLSRLGYSNAGLTDYLQKSGFVIGERSISPYRTTIYAIPSLFRMDTLAFSSEIAEMTAKSAILGNKLLQEQNTFTNYLKNNQYDIRSFSMFAIDKNKPVIEIPIGTTWLELQLLKILPWWVKNDLLHVIPSNKLQKIVGTQFANTLAYNSKALAFTRSSIRPGGNKPQFVFSHFLLPHPPVLLDSTGNERSIREGMYENNLSLPKFLPTYLDQLSYVNRITREIIDEMLTKDPNAVIILISDHGCRTCFGLKPEIFNIQWAMRIPGKKAAVSNDDMDLVNTFRILLNEIAGQNLPMVQTLPKY